MWEKTHGQMFNDISRAFDLAIDGRIDEAVAICSKNDSLYLRYGQGLLNSRGILTMEEDHLKNAIHELKKCLSFIDGSRKREGWSFSSPNFNAYTDEEAHSELIHAECSILLALLCVTLDQSFIGFVNGALYARSSNNGFKKCFKIMECKRTWCSDASRIHFKSGTRTATGMFELIVSFFPSKFVTLLEYVGFSGNRKFGLDQLKRSAALTDGLRYSLAVFGLVLFIGLLDNVFGLGEADDNYLIVQMDIFVQRYPNVRIH